MRKGEHPSYNREIADNILRDISIGIPVRKACRAKDPTTVTADTFYAWLADNVDGIAERYAIATRQRSEAAFEEIDDYCEKSIDELRVVEPERAKALAAFMRTVVDVKKWRIAKMRPEKYGDRPAADGSGQCQQPAPVVNVINVQTKEQLDRLISSGISGSGSGDNI